MASTHELKDVITETLENRGVLGQIKARIRAEVFNALDDHADSRPTLSNENLIINELIREYLEFNKYKYSASVLAAEAGQPKQPLDRRFLAEELNVDEDRNSSSVPLLYGVVSHFMKQNRGPGRAGFGGSRGRRLHDELATDNVTQDSSHITEPFVVQGGRK